MENNGVLEVKTFGGFNMIWADKMICGGIKSADSQFTRLMQVLVHNRKLGVDRTQLQNYLFEDSKAEDVHHLLRSTIYKARKKLENAGLPKCNYIELKNGNYFWTSEIPVKEDATDLEELFKQAMHEEDHDQRTKLFLDACYCYNGDFLPQQTRLAWVAQEERKYKMIFNTCVEEAAASLKRDNNWVELKRLGKHASSVCPLNEWELLTMDALISMGKCKEARALYEECVGYYQDELGVGPSVEMVNKLREIATRIELPNIQPEMILEQMNEPDDEISGGYLCSYYMFRAVYRMARRVMGASNIHAGLAICSLHGDEFAEDATYEKIRNIVCKSLCKTDIICQYSKSQFLILLQTSTQENCEKTMELINSNIKAEYPGFYIEYKISQIAPI